MVVLLSVKNNNCMASHPAGRLIPLWVSLAVLALRLRLVLSWRTLAAGIMRMSDWAYLNNTILAPQNNEDDWTDRKTNSQLEAEENW